VNVRRKGLLIIAWSSLLVAAGCVRMQVRSEYDTSVDFSRLATYRWRTDAERAVVDPRVDADFLQSVVHDEVDALLARKGFRYSEDAPDFLVGYQARVKAKLDQSKSNEAYGYSSGWWGPSDDVGQVPADPGVDYAREYDVGQLTVLAFDPVSGKPIWQASAKTEVYLHAAKAERAARIQEAVEKILAKFPPR